MERIWIHFTERQKEALRQDARARGIPISEIVRQLVTEHYHLPPEVVRPGVAYTSPEAVQAR